ncbi:hypothetical protein N7470_004699 [Penicillium chermesinum]|nr:hypothetical protein N7470_004699 [Penicillium chermesinum]
MSLQPWERQAQKGRDILQNSVPKQWLLPEDKLPPASQKDVTDVPVQCGLLSEHEVAITNLSATQLVAEMGQGKLSAEEVVIAFLKRSVLGHQLLNFATEFLADEAISRAKELDDYYKKTGKLVGPLHGVPISVKEHVAIKNKTCNTGYVAWVDQVASEDAYLLQLLHKAGAVFHVRTNQPQSLMHLCCENNITGKTLNPFNRTLTPGGSSGGEGAAAGFRCPPWVSAPILEAQSEPPLPSVGAMGQETILGVIGPLGSSSLDDLELFQRAVLDQEPWETDTSLVPLPWKRVTPTRDITIAIMWDDGCVRPHPPVTRALRLAKEKLSAAGITVVDWEPYKHQYGWDILSKLYYPDGASLQRKMLQESGEPALPLSEWAFSYGPKTPLTHPEAWVLQFQRTMYRAEYHGLIKSRGVDFIISPAYPGVAAVYGESHYWHYTAIWNLLDLPAVIFPSGLHVDPKLDALNGEDESYKPRNEIDEREWKKYQSPERYEGAPIGLQIAGRHFKDEETLAAAKIVEDIMKEGAPVSGH